MKSEHQTSRDMVKVLQQKGIPMATLKDGTWVPVLPDYSGGGEKQTW
jgi:hypothetical protein